MRSMSRERRDKFHMCDGFIKKKKKRKQEDRGGTYRRQVQSRRQTRLTCVYVCMYVYVCVRADLVRFLYFFLLFPEFLLFFSFLPKIFSSPPPRPVVGACYKRARAGSIYRQCGMHGRGERYYIYRRQLGTDLI